MQNKSYNTSSSDSYQSDTAFGHSVKKVPLTMAPRENHQHSNVCSLLYLGNDMPSHLKRTKMDCNRLSFPSESHQCLTASALQLSANSSSLHANSTSSALKLSLTFDGKQVFPWMTEPKKNSKQKSSSFCDTSNNGG